MAFIEKLKAYGNKHKCLLSVYRATLGKLKTKYFFDYQRRALQRNGLRLISNISDALTKHGAVFFLDFGSLLGVVRDGRLIAHDRDIDFGVYFDDNFTPAVLDQAMKEIGLKRVHTFLFRGDVKEVTYSSGVTHIDFFKHEETDTETMDYSFHRLPDEPYETDNQYSVTRGHSVHISGVKTIKISNYTLRIPENEEAYLESVYTAAWRVPNPKWTSRNNPGRQEKFPGEYGIKIKG